jgi:multidrug efflux system membrane fusion protein
VDPIYLNFDMSESDYATFQRERQRQKGPLADTVEVALNGESFSRQGTLDFVDNTLDRSSGTIHARATVPNSDGLLTPGQFARLRVAVSKPEPALLVPDASVLPDQSDHVVLTVGPDEVVTSKKVLLGDLRGGLRVIQAGLTPSDRVIIEGMPMARPGVKVNAETKTLFAQN